MQFFFLVAIPLWAQEETLVDGEVESGGFGGPVLKISRIKDEMAIFVGGRGGWIINHVFVLGGGGYGLVNDMKVRQVGDTSYFLMMGYGGLELEYINDSDRLIHYTIRALIGAGGLNLRTRNFDYGQWQGDAFFVVEPGVDVVLNVTNFFRIAAGVSYRLVSGVDFEGFREKDVSGPSAALTLKFGKF